jgi:DNA-binding PadR family transcriptional regulator
MNASMDRNFRLLRVLSCLQEGAAPAQDILERLADAGAAPAIASFYRDLNRALEIGWIEVADRQEPARPGRPARCYRLTRAGRSALRSQGRRLYDFASSALLHPRSLGKGKLS